MSDEARCAECGHTEKAHVGGCHVCRGAGDRCRVFVALPEPTAPQDGGQTLSEQSEDVALAISDLERASRAVGERWSSTGLKSAEREERAARAELEGEILSFVASRLSSLSTELVRVRGALTNVRSLFTYKDGTPRVYVDADLADCTEIVQDIDDALGGLVPPDASPRRTE